MCLYGFLKFLCKKVLLFLWYLVNMIDGFLIILFWIVWYMFLVEKLKSGNIVCFFLEVLKRLSFVKFGIENVILKILMFFF